MRRLRAFGPLGPTSRKSLDDEDIVKHYIRVTLGPYKGAIYEFPTKKDALVLARALEKERPHSTDYGNDRDGFPETHLKGQRAHATVKTEAAATDLPLKDKLQLAAKWIRREIKKRDDGSHPSHLAAKVLEEADEKFKLGSYGVEGWAKSPSRGYQYLNYGDPYDSTIVVRSNPTRAAVFVALGGWAAYAGGG